MSDHEARVDETVRAAILRLQAEKKMERLPIIPSLEPNPIETSRFVYELQVHQIELQMQNDELRRTRAEVNALLVAYTDLYDNAPVGYMTLDRAGTVIKVNRTGARMFGVDATWLVHRRLALFIESAERREFADFLQSVFAEAGPHRHDLSLPDVDRRRMVLRLEAVRGAHPDAHECRIALLDVTEQRLAEQERDLHSAALNSATDIIYIIDPNGHIEWVNSAFTSVTGYTSSEVVGKHTRDVLRADVYDQAFYDEIWRVLRSGNVWKGDTTNRRRDGTHFVEAMTVTPVIDTFGVTTHFVVIGRDQTELRLLEAQLLQAQRMETVGRLAGGIAHDFNNLLTVISGSAALAMQELQRDSPVYDDLREIEHAGARAALLTRQLLAFSRKQTMNFELIDLATFVRNMSRTLMSVLGAKIALVVSIPADVRPVRADIVQMEQVLLNLVLNARDATPAGGTVTVTVVECVIDSEAAAKTPGRQVGEYVCLSVADTGAGISKEIADRIFEPFFSTKSTSAGTGLGLSMVYGIVKQSGGSVFVDSELNVGTSLTVYLPYGTPVTTEPDGRIPPVAPVVSA